MSKANTLGNILVVDNSADERASLERLLRLKGYAVRTATDRDEALAIVADWPVQVAVIDVRLVKESDRLDVSGLRLAAEMPDDMAKIMLTAYRDGPLDVLLEALNPDQRGRAKARVFRLRESGPEVLLDDIRRALADVLHHNATADLSLEPGLAWRGFVDVLREAATKTEAEKKDMEAELETLLRRLVGHARAVHLERLPMGRGGGGVVVARTVLADGPGRIMVIKFGGRQRIMREYDRWCSYVRDRGTATYSTHVHHEPVASRDLAAIPYSFLGADLSHRGAQLVDFGKFYSREKATAIIEMLDHFLDETCAAWQTSGAIHAPEPQDARCLDDHYREHLNLDDGHAAALWTRFVEMMSSVAPGAHHFRPIGEDCLEIRFDPKRIQTVNPLNWAFREAATVCGGALFPRPSLLAITHGDPNEGNILVDSATHRVWMIDFYRTGWGPILRDLAQLESVIKFNLLQTESLLHRFQLEQALVAHTALDASLYYDAPTPELVKARDVIAHVRTRASALANTYDVREYLVGLLFLALKQMEYAPTDSIDPCCHVYQYHALLSAALTANRLAQALPPCCDG